MCPTDYRLWQQSVCGASTLPDRMVSHSIANIPFFFRTLKHDIVASGFTKGAEVQVWEYADNSHRPASTNLGNASQWKGNGPVMWTLEVVGYKRIPETSTNDRKNWTQGQKEN